MVINPRLANNSSRFQQCPIRGEDSLASKRDLHSKQKGPRVPFPKARLLPAAHSLISLEPGGLGSVQL
eukprot:1867886-Amphidinium_carterae.1